MKNKKICVIGLGYIGLPTAAFLANRGYHVSGVDINKSAVDTINRGEIHIVEPELDTFVKSAVNSGNLKAYLTPKKSDIFMIAVPTPFHDGFIPNIDYIMSACKSISEVLDEGNLIILESTSPVGTTEKLRDEVYKLRPDLKDKLYFSHAPERVLPGQIIRELSENDRIVGGIDKASTLLNETFYKTFVNGKILTTDARTAEMSKLTENSFRDVNIAFANELSMICDNVSIDIKELINLANHHPRVDILQPGTGVGGHCIAVDPYFIIHSDKKNSKIIKMAREVNNYKTLWVIEKIKNKALEFETRYNKKPKIVCLGLTFKPNVDDLRESPALSVVKSLVKNNMDVVVVEPHITECPDVEILLLDDAMKIGDIIVKLVAHDVFNLLVENDNFLKFV